MRTIREKSTWFMVILSIIAVFRVDAAYSLQVAGCDLSLRHSETVVTLSTGERFVLSEGENLMIERNVAGEVIQRAEMGWHKYPVKANRSLRISLRSFNAACPQQLAFCMIIGKKIRPNNFVNDVDGWNFSKQDLLNNKGKLLTLDIDFGEACSLNCPHCFRRNGQVNASGNPPLSYQETMGVIRQAKALGLRSIKILGAGEPFENRQFLTFLRDMKDMGIQVNVFTKAHVFGDDSLAQRYFGLSSLQLAQEIKRLGTSLNIGCNSFDPTIQDEMTGTIGYTKKRNRALKILTDVGLNDCQPTKLCLAMVPITTRNVEEIFDMYVWARERNIYPVTSTSMCAGRAATSWQGITPPVERLIALYTQINVYNVENGITTLQELKENGIASYAGGCPCHQVACGMYVTSRGIVLRCPGDDVTVFGNVREQSVADIWHNSESYLQRQGTFNCHCPPKDSRSIPTCLYGKVLENIVRHFEA